MKKHLFVALLTIAAVTPVMADDETDARYRAFISAYGFFVVHAENCDLASRFAVTAAFLSDLAARGVDATSVEKDMRSAADSERPFSGGACRPEMARYWADQTGTKHLDLLATLL